MIHIKNKILTICILIISLGEMFGQIYYGKQKFGKIKIIGDSIAIPYFLKTPYRSFSDDTCIISRNADTLFLTTKVTWLYKVHLYPYAIVKQNIGYLTSAVLYVCSPYEPNNWVNSSMAGWYDSINKMHYIDCFYNLDENYVHMIVLSRGERHSRAAFYIKESNFYYTIGLEENPLYKEGSTGVVLDHFPLLKKGNRLIPCSELKQAQCWVDNGFFFPTMKRGTNPYRSYKWKATKNRGLQDLPYGILQQKKSLPKKYFDIFRDTTNMRYFPAIIEINNGHL
jgi:hypothetical protein